jgi:hypothetical protein
MEALEAQIFLAYCEYKAWCALNSKAHQAFITFRMQQLKNLELIHTWLTGDPND